MQPGTQNHQQASRVCDTCIQKKVRCDRGQPVCFYCFSHGYACDYSQERRRPGPQRGLRRAATRSVRSSPLPIGAHSQHLHGGLSHSPEDVRETTSPNERRASAIGVTSNSTGEVLNAEPPWPPVHRSRAETRGARGRIRPHEEAKLLQMYLETLHNAFPLFPSPLSVAGLVAHLADSDLKLCVLVITAKVTAFVFEDGELDVESVESVIESMLRSASFQAHLYDDVTSINQFRQGCLLAFYEFHQFPGHQAWMHVGQIVRTAHWMGLHCMDGRRAKSSRLRAVAEEQLEEWRCIWWSLYCLDSYVNLASGTNFLIDDRLVNTAFPRPNPSLSEGRPSSQSQEPLLLPSELESLWTLVPVVTAGPQSLVTLNMHIVTTTTLRHAGRCLFSHLLRPSKETLSRFVAMDGPLSALQLALPPRYLIPGRNAFSNESPGDHHARLVSVLHLRMSSLLTTIGRCVAVKEEGPEWVTTWQRVLEICQDIAAISKQWDGTFSLAVDPAVAIILFTAAVFNNLQWKSAGNGTAALNASFRDCELVLVLHLDQFASYWALPRLLKLSFMGFKEACQGPFGYKHIQLILGHFEAPMSPAWLEFLSAAPSYLESCS